MLNLQRSTKVVDWYRCLNISVKSATRRGMWNCSKIAWSPYLFVDIGQWRQARALGIKSLDVQKVRCCDMCSCRKGTKNHKEHHLRRWMQFSWPQRSRISTFAQFSHTTRRPRRLGSLSTRTLIFQRSLLFYEFVFIVAKHIAQHQWDTILSPLHSARPLNRGGTLPHWHIWHIWHIRQTYLS